MFLKGVISRLPCTWSVKCNILNTNCNIVFKALHYKFKLEVRMQFKNAITIVHAMVGMCSMHKLFVPYLEHRFWTRIEVK